MDVSDGCVGLLCRACVVVVVVSGVVYACVCVVC